MKYIILTCAFCFSCSLAIGQGIIGDIMNVETVSVDLSVINEKLITKYNATLTKETAELESDLLKIDQEYKNDVTNFIEAFSKKLKEGEEKMVNNLKSITVSRVNSLTMTHQTEKKNRVQHFQNKLQIANRRLPVFLRPDATAQVDQISSTHFETIKSDYAAHRETIKAFEAQEHLIVIEGESLSAN